ncbi:MAG: 23S rRNA (pseudouridine(1915)-N(3))-methyltransferase RlmH [Ruminococcus sp.]|jgi:23S rRNA (pseudouridine1915-N3)-methyltransferase|nr:23S rRNA (pseudouridine(1915)-N(3))-methyltransferase RlmH [Ruminococcus sp.]
MKIKIISIGKLKSEFAPALNEYTKRLGRFCKFEIIELSESYLPENPSEVDIAKALSAEAVSIKKHIAGEAVALALDGKSMSSEDLAEYIKDKSELSFVIGSSHGLSREILSEADLKLSFSKFTFPHSLMRVILAEQLYRAFMINSGSKYHK